MNTLEFCKKYLENYTINPDDMVDIDRGVYLYGLLGNMKKLPIKFGKVSGDFDCAWNNLTTLEGCPNYVGRHFYCDILTHHILGNVYGKIYFTKQRIII
jgi:hypothetical protein